MLILCKLKLRPTTLLSFFILTCSQLSLKIWLVSYFTMYPRYASAYSSALIFNITKDYTLLLNYITSPSSCQRLMLLYSSLPCAMYSTALSLLLSLYTSLLWSPTYTLTCYYSNKAMHHSCLGPTSRHSLSTGGMQNLKLALSCSRLPAEVIF